MAESCIAASLAEGAFLLPGEMAIVDAPARVKTVLGSCVAITMRSARLGTGAVAHCLLPQAPAAAYSLPRVEALKYVDAAIEIMLTIFAQRGASAGELEVKLFGGSENLNSYSDGPRCVGGSNAATALAVLAARGIIPAACDMGGGPGRVLEFHSDTGDVYIKRLPEVQR